ncbi:MAG: NAD-dependent epimerase/dehydratase family protein [Planctomycetota bacterium]
MLFPKTLASAPDARPDSGTLLVMKHTGKLKPFALPGDSLRERRVLVTGATGFVGGRLAERLHLEQRADVVALVRNWTRAVWVSRYQVEMSQGDVQDFEPVSEAMKGCDIVFHCASGGGSMAEFMSINVNGTENVIKACLKHGVKRLIYVSSIAVHGPSPPDGADENDAYRSMNRGYSDSKIEAEKRVLRAGRESDLEVVIVRPTFVWGPRSALFTVRPLREIAGGSFRFVDEGQGDCHAVFIETLVDAIIAAATVEDAVGRSYLVTDGYGLKWREFYSRYAELLGVDPDSIGSLSSKSRLVRWRGAIYQRMGEQLERWKSNPAPLWRKVLRRSTRITADQLYRFGVMSEWDLAKFARRGSLNTRSTIELLNGPPRYSYEEAFAMTEAWVRDQLSDDLGIPRLGSAT